MDTRSKQCTKRTKLEDTYSQTAQDHAQAASTAEAELLPQSETPRKGVQPLEGSGGGGEGVQPFVHHEPLPSELPGQNISGIGYSSSSELHGQNISGIGYSSSSGSSTQSRDRDTTIEIAQGPSSHSFDVNGIIDSGPGIDRSVSEIPSSAGLQSQNSVNSDTHTFVQSEALCARAGESDSRDFSFDDKESLGSENSDWSSTLSTFGSDSSDDTEDVARSLAGSDKLLKFEDKHPTALCGHSIDAAAASSKTLQSDFSEDLSVFKELSSELVQSTVEKVLQSVSKETISPINNSSLPVEVPETHKQESVESYKSVLQESVKGVSKEGVQVSSISKERKRPLQEYVEPRPPDQASDSESVSSGWSACFDDGRSGGSLLHDTGTLKHPEDSEVLKEEESHKARSVLYSDTEELLHQTRRQAILEPDLCKQEEKTQELKGGLFYKEESSRSASPDGIQSNGLTRASAAAGSSPGLTASKQPIVAQALLARRMGSGATKCGDVDAVNEHFADHSTAAMSTASGKNAEAVSSSSSVPGRKTYLTPHSSMAKSSARSSRASRFNEGFEDVEVIISQDGFSQQEVNIMEGQVVRCIRDQTCPNNAKLIQVIYDGEELRPVIGGYEANLDDNNGVYQQQINLEGEYKFALSGIRCTPLVVKVRRRIDLQVEVTDEGIIPEIMYIDQGTAVQWSWKQTKVPHTLMEMTYVIEKGCLSRQPLSQGMVATTTGSHRQIFSRPGMYYFRTEGSDPGKTHMCVVCVQSLSREYRVEVLDRSFQPMILLIETGDRVWFSWDRFKCKKLHSVYQIKPPATDHQEDIAYEPLLDGFKWATPSKQGLISHRFDSAGVYYYSDQNFDEAAEYIGTIIVKPKQREHIVKVQENSFSPDILRVTTGDRVWWTWDGQAVADVGEGLLLLEEDKVLNPLANKNTSTDQSEHYQELDGTAARLITRVGVSTIQFTTVGVYTYKVSDVGDNFNSFSVLVNPGSKNHTIHLTDEGFEPKVITVSCNDRVWWVWQGGKKQHNIVQVSHQGQIIPDGFCSGQPRDSPSAFMHNFCLPGVYYFVSKSLPQLFGAVVVSTRPQVHEVLVKNSEICPDPVTVQLNDVVAWVFGKLQQYDVTLVETVDQVLDTGSHQNALAPRRSFARAISQIGTMHFKSKSFQKGRETNFMEETRLSTVVCDDRSDNIIVQLDKKGFHPESVYLQKGQSLLWSWKGTDENHNIIHVTDPNCAWEKIGNEETPLNMIKGPRAFNSGRPLINDSFLYTFDEDGTYTVVSQGAPGFSCTINVLEVAPRTAEPCLSEQTSTTVERYTNLHLKCQTPDSKIYYTLDGSRPSTVSKEYQPDKGVTLRESGFHVVRAIAVADKHLQSHIFTSKRFWVLSGGDVDHDSDESAASDQETAVPRETKAWDWWNCKPQIKGCFTTPGTMEIFWDPPSPEAVKQIRAYQIYLNGVSYCPKFPNSSNSLKLVGLAGGRNYSVVLRVFPNNASDQVLESNILQLACPKVAPLGGPVISLEVTPDDVTLAVVWMSITSRSHPVDGYQIFLNDQQCGPKLIPEEGANRCKVVIGGCETGVDYKIHVLATYEDSNEASMSNVLVVQLPLDTVNIIPPPIAERLEDEELYLEYIEVMEGSGYLDAMDELKDKIHTKESESESGSETETESETESESESETETETETESEKDVVPLRKLTDQVVHLGSHTTDGVQNADARKIEVEHASTAVSSGIAAFPHNKSSLRSFADLQTFHYELASQSNLSKKKPAEEITSTENSIHKRVSFRVIAQSIKNFIHHQKIVGEKTASRKTGKVNKSEKIEWNHLRAYVNEKRQLQSDQIAAHRLSQIVSGGQKGKSAIRSQRSRPGLNKMASPKPVPRHGKHLRVEDAHLRSYERFTNEYDEELPEDDLEEDDPRQRLPELEDDEDEYYDDTNGARDRKHFHPSGSPRRGLRLVRDVDYDEPRYSRQAVLRSRSPEPQFRGRDVRRRQYSQFDYSPERQSHSSLSSQRQYPGNRTRLRPDRSPYYQKGSSDKRMVRQASDEYPYRKERQKSQRVVQTRSSSSDIPRQIFDDGSSTFSDGRKDRSHSRDERYQGNRQRERLVQLYNEGLDSDALSDKDSVEHLYISPRYAERLDDNTGQRKSVQFYFGPADEHVKVDTNRKQTHSSHLQNKRLPLPDESMDSQVSNSETVVQDCNEGYQYVLNEPYGNVPVYGQEQESPSPCLPVETGGMLSQFLEIVNHVPYIREDLLDGDAQENVTIVPSRIVNQPCSSAMEYCDEAVSEIQYRDPVSQNVQKEGLQQSTQQILDDSSSEYETDSTDSESDFDRPSGGHVVILDASKNEVIDTKPRNQWDQGTGSMAIVGHGGKHKQSNEIMMPAALIEVQKNANLKTAEHQESSDIPERSKLSVVGGQKSEVMEVVKEGEFVNNDTSGVLPAPSISATTKGKHGVKVAWELPRQPDPQYKLLLFVVNVVGTRFSSEINSHISFECNLVENGKQVRGVQHCWNIQGKKHCVIKGLHPGLTYRIYVVANYSLVYGSKPCEIQTTSSVLYFTTLGPPKAPHLRIVRVDLNQVCLAWDEPSPHDKGRIHGYQINVDGKPLGGLRNPEIRQMVINNLVPGRTMTVNIVSVLARAGQESAPSKTIHITSPVRPPAPTISQQPSYRKGCVLIAWDKPNAYPEFTESTITSYSIYVDGNWHGEIKANKMSDKQGYQFFLTDLEPEQSYDVSVKAIAGDRHMDADAQHIFCLSESIMSNNVTVMAPAAPKSPKLRLEGLHPDGIDVTWQTPQQSGDAIISGYQMLKNGKLYGSIIPPDVNSLRIRDVSLGEKLSLQLIALTEHPVGKGDNRAASITGDKDSGIGGSTTQPEERSAASPQVRESQKVITFTHHIHAEDWPTVESDVFAGDRYAGCKPGPKLVVHYTGLVSPPSEVWCERATGHSALIVWNIGEEHKAHFLHPDSYQVTWWPGDSPQDDINSDSTTDDHLLITNLRPSTTYTVVVEARKMEKYSDIDEGVSPNETPEGLNAFILSSKSEHLIVKTSSPPDSPRNVGITATTCNSLRVAWDPPQENGSEVIAIRIECVSLNSLDPHHVIEDIMPDSTSADITGLHEKTDYLVRVIAVTEEYFDRLPEKHKHKKLHSIPRDMLLAQEESQWLPSTSIITKTAGTEAPTNIRLTQSTTTSLVLSWTPPLVYGSNKLLSQIVRWRDIRRTKPTDPEELVVASHVNLLPTEDTLTISDLVPGSQYQVVIEAVVSIKTSLSPDQWDSGIEKNRRTAHVMSKPINVWTRAPVEPPKVLVTSYDQSTANLYWEKPSLMSIIGKDPEGNPRYLRRYLEGYRLEINGKLQSSLGPATQTCTLTKCKPGKQYRVVLIAMTCTEERRHDRREKFKGYFKTIAPQESDYTGLLNDELLDQSPSDPVDVILPKPQEGFLETLEAKFVHHEERDSRTFGDVDVSWTIQGQSNLLKQFSIVWYSSEDRVIQTKYVGPEKRHTTIPVTYLKTIYNIAVEPCYYTDVLPQQPQDIQIVVPGPPDAPEIFLRSQDAEEFVIEWGEPRCYGGVKVKGYQVYMNDKKIGNELNSSHRKAVIPCRVNRTYSINLVALSSVADFGDSPKSNTLLINTGKMGPSSMNLEEYSSTADDREISLKVTQVTETGIHLDWSTFFENQDVAYYKIQWSSVAQPAQREVRLSQKDISCVINKCLPGTTHFVRLVAFSEDGQIIDKSKQLTVQTSAPPDAPVLSVRACNFRYIAIQWEKPTTYGDALVTGYKVYVNGIVEAVLSADTLSYTFTQGHWCQEYSFQVQALTAGDHLNSKPSEPLVLIWPGTKAPQIRRVPATSSSSLRVAWDSPHLTEGVKVKHYKLCCVEEGTEKLVQSVSPIHPDSREAEFKHLNPGGYMVFLETHLYGTGEVVRSEPIRMQPAVAPDPPQITVTVVGLEERRQLEKLACDLANKRDRLIRAVGHKLKRIGALNHPLRAEKDEDVVMGAHALTGVEELLDACFTVMENYTGQLIAHMSWQCPQSNEDVHLSGFKVLVDGKQYGSSMHAGVRTVRLQLGLEEPSYLLSMVSLSDKPQGCSVESNVVELLSSPFHPFSYYCYHTIHSRATKWPQQGCCKYQDSLSYERKVGKKLANQGLLAKHIPPPACSLLDIFAGDYKPLMSGHRPQYPSVLLFWTPWCLSSQKIMDHFVRFARGSAKEFNFIAVTCGMSGVIADDRQALVHQLTSHGWREDGVILHCTSECASNVYRTTSTISQTASNFRTDQDLVSDKYMDLTEIIGIAGVPTFLFIHPEGYISWHGRYSAYDYASFSAFMRHTNSEVMKHPCPVFNCDCCKNDTSIDHEMISTLLPESSRNKSQTTALKTSEDNSETNLASLGNSRFDLKYAAINGFTENASGTEKVFLASHKPSPRRRPKLSINSRPFSASATAPQLQSSPYLAKVAPSKQDIRTRNRPVSAKFQW